MVSCGMSKYHITIHIEVDAPDLFIAQRKGELIAGRLPEEYNAFVSSVFEEKNEDDFVWNIDVDKTIMFERLRR